MASAAVAAATAPRQAEPVRLRLMRLERRARTPHLASRRRDRPCVARRPAAVAVRGRTDEAGMVSGMSHCLSLATGCIINDDTIVTRGAYLLSTDEADIGVRAPPRIMCLFLLSIVSNRKMNHLVEENEPSG